MKSSSSKYIPAAKTAVPKKVRIATLSTTKNITCKILWKKIPY